MKQVIMYTDGACRGNPGPGGWGVLLKFNGTQKEIFGGSSSTTNNKMELKAAIEGLRLLTEPCSINLYTDSKYVMDGITQWINNWKKNNWKTSTKKDVKNKELWQELDNLMDYHEVTLHWVKGHSGDEGNEMADMLANKGIDSL
jgi:ribonuclease HI